MKLQLHWKIFIGLCAGLMIGLLARAFNVQDIVTENVSVIGTVFLRALRMIVVPLIVSSVISSVAGSGSAEKFSRLGLKTVLYYVFTSLLAIVTGLILANIIKPGVGANLGLESKVASLPVGAEKFGDILLGIIPTNPLASMVNGEIVPALFFALFFGFFITRAPDPYRKHLTECFQAVFEVMMLFTQFIIRFAPVGVMALIADITVKNGPGVFVPLGAYMLTVVLGLLIHALITLPVLLCVSGASNPFALFKAVTGALITAFSTASSSATLPLTIDSVRKNAGVSYNVSGFVLPLGATINMDGTALYECVAAIFIAQAYGIELSFIQQLLIVFTALLASIGAAAVPMAGLVMITIILRAVGLPLEGVGLILAVDRVLDMMRSSVNVWSDTCGAVIIAKSEGELKN